jgi:6-phosphogluconolactonase
MRVIETTHAADAATSLIADALITAIAERGRAVLLVSGGSSPKPVFARLSDMDVDWTKVTVGLVDERVDPKGSNANFVKEHLLRGRAAGASFVAMKGGDYSPLIPADMCVMGMGGDGHTASWFPGTKDLDVAMDVSSPDAVVEVDTTGAAGNSGFPERLTLTLPAVMASRDILLFIPGAAKRAVFHARQGLPVDALTHSERLTVICEPSP